MTAGGTNDSIRPELRYTGPMAFVVSFALFLAGIFLFYFAFNVESLQALVFFAGIIAISLSFGIPAHLLAKR